MLLCSQAIYKNHVFYTVPCRFEECKTKLTPFLKTVGFNPKTGTVFMCYNEHYLELILKLVTRM